jgi:glycosyltransferase involved in cell wall biosynthesis
MWSFRVIVVDNGSTDTSREVASAAGAIVVTERRRSSYAARNRGASQASAPLIAFTDADCIPDPNWLYRAAQSMDRNGWDICAGAVHHEPSASRVGRFDELTYLKQEEYVEGEFHFGATANLLVRAEVFRGIGGFDSALRSGGDLDFCRRATRGGASIGFEPQAIVTHPPRETLVEVLRKAWRIGTGQAEVGLRDRPVLRWGLSPRRLAPDRRTVTSNWRTPSVIAIATIESWTAWLARVVRVSRWGP